MNDILFFVLVAKELQFTFKKRISGKLEIPVESLGVLMAIRHKASMIQQEIEQVRRTGMNCYRYAFISRSGFDAQEDEWVELIPLEKMYE